MRLSFLGNSYESSTPSVKTIKTEHSGVFLGNRFKLQQHMAFSRHQPTTLKYRGVDYDT